MGGSSGDHFISSLFAGFKNGTTILINVTTNDTINETIAYTTTAMDLRYRGMFDVVTGNSIVYLVDCHAN